MPATQEEVNVKAEGHEIMELVGTKSYDGRVLSVKEWN